eukprot:m.10444 g.10444  ORF g.10444 m.10444 type:complete len:50 (-) comp4320_c0_seq1:251-400(-)
MIPNPSTQVFIDLESVGMGDRVRAPPRDPRVGIVSTSVLQTLTETLASK